MVLFAKTEGAGALRAVQRRRRLATVSARMLPKASRQKFVYDRSFRNEIEAVAFPMAKNLDWMPDFQSPKSYVEKMRSLWLTHPNPLMSLVADKVAVRDYFALYDLPIKPLDLIGVYEDPADLDLAALPQYCMLKINNGTNMNLWHSPDMPVTPKRLKLFLDRCWNRDHWRNFSELHYRDIPRKLLIEEPMLPLSGLAETGVFCAMGVPYFVNYETEGVLGFFTPDGRPRPHFEPSRKPQGRYDCAPDQLDLMVECARQLSAPFAHVRVDFMQSAGRLVLGEMTLSPGALLGPYRPIEADIERGHRIDLTRLPALLDQGRKIAATLDWPLETSFGHFAGDARLKTAGR